MFLCINLTKPEPQRCHIIKQIGLINTFSINKTLWNKCNGLVLNAILLIDASFIYKYCLFGEWHSLFLPVRLVWKKRVCVGEKWILHVRNVGQFGEGILRNRRKFCPHKPPETDTNSVNTMEGHERKTELTGCGYLHLLRARMENGNGLCSKTWHTVDVPVTLAMSWTIFQRESDLDSAENGKKEIQIRLHC